MATKDRCSDEFQLKHGYVCELPKGHAGDHEATCPNPQFHQTWPGHEGRSAPQRDAIKPHSSVLYTEPSLEERTRHYFEQVDPNDCTGSQDCKHVCPESLEWTKRTLQDCIRMGMEKDKQIRNLEKKLKLPAPSMLTKRRIFIDMDGVIVDFDAYARKLDESGDEIKKRAGAYLRMEPIPGALEAVRSLIGMGYDVWLATKPPTGIAFAYADKAQWVFDHLPELKRKLILTHDKGLLGCAEDFLIDDRPHKANCEKFPGTLIRFTNGETWSGVLSRLARAEVGTQKKEDKL